MYQVHISNGIGCANSKRAFIDKSVAERWANEINQIMAGHTAPHAFIKRLES